MSEIILIRVNCPSEDLAASLAEAAVKGHLAACANIEGPIASVYHWDGKIERGERLKSLSQSRQSVSNSATNRKTAKQKSSTSKRA